MGRVVFALGITLLAACSSSTTGSSTSSGGGTCGKIADNYSVDSVRTTGTCGPIPGEGEGPSTVVINQAADGSYAVTVPGAAGDCPAKVEGCNLTATCEVRDAKGGLLATFSIDWTISPDGLTGTESAGFQPPVVPKLCQAEYEDTGTRR